MAISIIIILQSKVDTILQDLAKVASDQASIAIIAMQPKVGEANNCVMSMLQQANAQDQRADSLIKQTQIAIIAISKVLSNQQLLRPLVRT